MLGIDHVLRQTIHLNAQSPRVLLSIVALVCAWYFSSAVIYRSHYALGLPVSDALLSGK